MKHALQVLIVEDEVDIRETLQHLLEMEGFRVSTASNGEQALDSIKDMTPPLVILLDLMMPIMTGWEFIHALDSLPQTANIPVIVVSAFIDTEIPLKARATVCKPIDIPALLKLIRECNASANPVAPPLFSKGL